MNGLSVLIEVDLTFHLNDEDEDEGAEETGGHQQRQESEVRSRVEDSTHAKLKQVDPRIDVET